MFLHPRSAYSCQHRRDQTEATAALAVPTAGPGIITETGRISTNTNDFPHKGKIVQAGTGKKGVAGLGGDPLQAELDRPHGVFVHPSGELHITDSYNNRIVKIVAKK